MNSGGRNNKIGRDNLQLLDKMRQVNTLQIGLMEKPVGWFFKLYTQNIG